MGKPVVANGSRLANGRNNVCDFKILVIRYLIGSVRVNISPCSEVECESENICYHWEVLYLF